MIRLLPLGLMLVACSAFAQDGISDIFLAGGALRGLQNTTWTAEFGFISKRSNHFGLGFAYSNDGHIPDNHRDGLTAQAWYLLPLDEDFEIQVGTGPYASMNNTTVDGVRQNQFRLGLLTSAALKWHPTSNPWYLRAQYNSTWVPNSFNSNALLFGVGRVFGYRGEVNTGRLNADVSLWGGWSRTTQVGPQRTAVGYQVESKFHVQRSEHLAYSVGFLSEGDTNLADRKGIPVQVWYDQALNERVTVSAGVGPYFAYNGIGSGRFRINGIGSLRLTFLLIDRYEAGIMYTRVASFINRDQDIVMIGLLAHL